MTKYLAIAIASFTLVGIDAPTANAASGLSTEFLCAAKASQQRLLPGSAARKASIQNCIAAALAAKGPAKQPVTPKDVGPSRVTSPPAPAAERRPGDKRPVRST